MRLGRQGESVEHLVGVPTGAVALGGEKSSRHVLPQEVLERTNLVVLNRVLGVDNEAVLARKLAEAPGIGWAGCASVSVQVEAAGNARVHRTRPRVGVGHGLGTIVWDFEVVRAKEINRGSAGLVVELVDQNDVRIHSLNGFRHVGCLGVIRRGEVVE